MKSKFVKNFNSNGVIKNSFKKNQYFSPHLKNWSILKLQGKFPYDIYHYVNRAEVLINSIYYNEDVPDSIAQ